MILEADCLTWTHYMFKIHWRMGTCGSFWIDSLHLKLNNWKEIRLAGWCHQNCIVISLDKNNLTHVSFLSFHSDCFRGQKWAEGIQIYRNHLFQSRFLLKWLYICGISTLYSGSWIVSPVGICEMLHDCQWWRNLRKVLHTVLQQANLIQRILCDVRWNRITAQLFQI